MMVADRLRTPGIWLTEQQMLALLDDLQILRVTRPEGGLVTLTRAGANGIETLTVTELKATATAILAELEDRKREIEENQFAPPLEADIPTSEEKTLHVQYAKRDDQLTREEGAEKERLLREVAAEIARQRLVLGGMNYLQIHYRELQPRLAKRDVPLEGVTGRRSEARLVWTKGIKSAAIYCIKEAAKPVNAGRPGVEICKEFFEKYQLPGEEDYTPEQLYRNVQQIRLLDRAE